MSLKVISALLLIATTTGFYCRPTVQLSRSIKMSATTENPTKAFGGEPGAAPLNLEWPGLQKDMKTTPDCGEETYKGTGKLKGKRAVITGGDSGIGRAVAIAFAREGADVLISHLPEEQVDADDTGKWIEESGRKVVKVAGDIRTEEQCKKIIDTAVKELGGIDILINNAGFQNPCEQITDISSDQFDRTMKTNLYAPFWITKHAIKYMKEGSAIVNTASVFGYQAPPLLLDYATTKAGVVNFTKVLGQQLISKGIRVNAVAPGPINTPMNPATMPDSNIEKLGAEAPYQRPGQPIEVANAFVFLASNDASYITSEVLAVTGGMVIA